MFKQFKFRPFLCRQPPLSDRKRNLWLQLANSYGADKDLFAILGTWKMAHRLAIPCLKFDQSFYYYCYYYNRCMG